MFNANKKKIILFIFTGIILHFSHPLNSDEGTVLNGAWNLYNHQKIYVDFDSFVAPGSYFLTKLSFDLLGPNYWSAKLFSLILLLISIAALYKIVHLLTSNKKLALIVSWLWLIMNAYSYPLINYNSHSTFVSIIASYYLIKATRFDLNKDFFLAGIFFGLITLFLQHKGIILNLSIDLLIFILMLLKREKPLKFLLLLSGEIVVPLIAVIIWGHDLLIKNLFLWVLKNDVPFNSFSYVIPAMLMLTMSVMSFWLYKNKSVWGLGAIIILVIQGALIVSVYSRLDPPHILVNSFGLFIIASLVIFNLIVKFHLTRVFHPHRLFLGFYGFIFLSVLLLAVNMNSSLAFFNLKNKLKADINSEKVYFHPYLPGLYFELKIPNKYPYDFLISGLPHPQAAFEKNLAVLKSENPSYIVINYEMVEKFNYNRNNPLDNYIRDKYVEFDHVGGVQFLKIKRGS